MQKRRIVSNLISLALLVLCSFFVQSALATINVKDFGAKGDGVTDDTDAIRAAFKAAHDYKQKKMTPNYHQKYGYFTTFPEVYFPSGHYIIHDTIDISGPNIRGEGYAAIEQKDPQKDIFYCSSTWQRTIEGLTFLGGKKHLNLGNKNLDKGLVEIRDCKFYHSGDVAVQMRKGSYSTTFQIRSCLFKECEQAVIGNSDYTVIRDTWITSSRKMKNDKAVIENRHGTMTLDHIVGVPLVSGADQRWVDNHGNLVCKEVRFGGEGGGFTPIINFAKRQPAEYGPYIVVEDSLVCAQGAKPSRKCAVYLEEIPNTVSIQRSALLGVKAISISPNIDLKTYFAGVKPGMLQFTIEDNMGEFVGDLPELLKNPILEGMSEDDMLPALSEKEANKAIKSAIAKQTNVQKDRKEALPVEYQGHKQQTVPGKYMEIVFDRKKWSLDDHVDALSDKNSKYLTFAPAGDDIIVLRKRTDKWPHVLIKDITIDLDKFPYLTWKLTKTGKGVQKYAVKVIEKKSQTIVTWESDIAPPWDAYYAYNLREKFNLEGGIHSFDIKFYYLPWAMTDSITSVKSNLGDYLVIDFIRAESSQ